MSQRTDERKKALEQFDCYNKAEKLMLHTMSVCKPKENKPNNKHIPKRLTVIGQRIMETCIEMGADILEANDIYVGSNLPADELVRHYQERIALEEEAKRKTYRMEFMINALAYNFTFADSTITYWTDLLLETREKIRAWEDTDKSRLKKALTLVG